MPGGDHQFEIYSVATIMSLSSPRFRPDCIADTTHTIGEIFDLGYGDLDYIYRRNAEWNHRVFLAEVPKSVENNSPYTLTDAQGIDRIRKESHATPFDRKLAKDAEFDAEMTYEKLFRSLKLCSF